jgi:hypothetical protein
MSFFLNFSCKVAWFQWTRFFIVCACEVDFVKGENRMVQSDIDIHLDKLNLKTQKK